MLKLYLKQSNLFFPLIMYFELGNTEMLQQHNKQINTHHTITINSFSAYAKTLTFFMR